MPEQLTDLEKLAAWQDEVAKNIESADEELHSTGDLQRRVELTNYIKQAKLAAHDLPLMKRMVERGVPLSAISQPTGDSKDDHAGDLRRQLLVWRGKASQRERDGEAKKRAELAQLVREGKISVEQAHEALHPGSSESQQAALQREVREHSNAVLDELRQEEADYLRRYGRPMRRDRGLVALQRGLGLHPDVAAARQAGVIQRQEEFDARRKEAAAKVPSLARMRFQTQRHKKEEK